MFCNIGGHIPQEPVVSRKNGALFERRLIEQQLAQTGKCPVTNEPMTSADLVAVSSGPNFGPRSGGVASVPSLLSSLHAEWDALMLEQFALRQQLAQAQQELSLAAYKHDAACRVIARLVKERDDLAAAVAHSSGVATASNATFSSNPSGAPRTAAAMVEDEQAGVVPDVVVADIEASKARLHAQRKRKEHLSRAKVGATNVAKFTETLEFTPPHTFANGTPANVLCVATQHMNGGKVVLCGGADGKATVFDVARAATAGSMMGHTKAVRHIVARPDGAVTGSDDGTARLWRVDAGIYKCASVVKGHAGAVTGVAVLPSGAYVLTSGADGTLRLSDLETGGTVVTQRPKEMAQLGIQALALHPEGFMAATGTGAAVHLWDVRKLGVDLMLPLADHGGITTIAFSDDSVTVAIGTSRGVVELTDVRFLNNANPISVLFHEDEAATTRAQGGIRRVTFDPSGQFLASTSQNVVQLWDKKDASLLTALSNHVDVVSDVAWGPDASWVVASSLDRKVKIFGVSE